MVDETRVKTGNAAHGLRILRCGLRPMSIWNLLCGFAIALAFLAVGFAFAAMTP